MVFIINSSRGISPPTSSHLFSQNFSVIFKSNFEFFFFFLSKGHLLHRSWLLAFSIFVILAKLNGSGIENIPVLLASSVITNVFKTAQHLLRALPKLLQVILSHPFERNCTIILALLLLLLSCSVVSNSLGPHGQQHARLPCPSPTPWVFSNSSPLNLWYHLTVSSSAVPFSSCLQSFPASGSLPMSWLFASDGQSIGPSGMIVSHLQERWNCSFSEQNFLLDLYSLD